MKLEHANMTVPSIEKSMRFLATVFPEFQVRGEGEAGEGPSLRRWLHFGTDSSYIALEELKKPPEPKPYRPYSDLGINHLCYEVEKIDPIMERLRAGGFPVRVVPNETFRKRIYVDDNVGNEWEFVQYLSDEPAKKNQYE